MRKLSSIIALVLCLSVQAKDLNLMEAQAASGDLQAQFDLASHYHQENKFNLAFKWLLKASEQGHAKAQLNLSSLYFNGEGTAKNTDEAVKWLIKAGEQDVREAQVHLNLLYHRGLEIPQNLKRAAYWAEKAAKRGHVQSQYILAVYHDAGNGVAQSDELSTYWFSEAAKQGHVKAQTRLAMAYQYGIGIEVNTALSKKWFTSAANSGDLDAKALLVIAYEESFKDDKSMLEHWSKQVALSKDLEAMFMLSRYYFSLNRKSGYENSYVWAHLMMQNGAQAQKLIDKLSKQLSSESIELAINKANNFASE